MNKALLILLLFAASAMDAQLQYEIKPLSLNTKHFNEFSAFPYKDGIVYCSNSKKEFSWLEYHDQQDGNFTSMLYSKKLSNGWSAPEVFSKELQTHLCNGPLAFSENQSRIFYSQSQLTEKKLYNGKENVPLGIFYADSNSDRWSAAKPFVYNNPEHSVSHPSLSADGKQLYFVSNASGGYGGTDIYVCTLNESGWSQPVNAGPVVNTEGNEMFPFIHPTGRLYFSSTSHNALGGLDIFYVKSAADGGWQGPIALPEPVNSKQDDFAYVSAADDQQGFFSSNRNGTDDLFEFKYPWPEFTKCDSLRRNNHCYVFFQEGEAVDDSLPILYEWVLGDGTKLQGKEVEHCYVSEGVYHVELNVIDKESGKVFYSEASYDIEIKDVVQPFINCTDTIKSGELSRFDALSSNLPGFGLQGYYWDFGDGSRDTGRVVEHLYASAGVFPVLLGAVSTDGSKKACVQKYVAVGALASQQAHRVDSVRLNVTALPEKEKVVYSVEVARSEEPISMDNSGFDKLQADYVLKETYLKDKNVYSYTVGEEPTMTEVFPVYKDVVGKGFDSASVKSYIDNIITLDQALVTDKEVLRTKVIRLFSTQFASASAELNKAAKSEVDKLYRLMMKDPGIRVHVSAHTDDEGAEEANMKLSMQRAQTIINYLVKKGVGAERVTSEGFGESRPIAANSTEEGKKMNRRVEITVKY